MTRPRHTKDETVELVSDAWERFEKAIKVIAKAKPIHRPIKKKRAKRKTT